MGDLAGLLKADGIEVTESPVSAENLGCLIKLHRVKAKSVASSPRKSSRRCSPRAKPRTRSSQREGLEQISDEGALAKIIDEVIATNPKQVEQYRGGKTAVIGFLVGAVMKASRGQADPAAVNRMLKERL